jgi:hypothetical protein
MFQSAEVTSCEAVNLWLRDATPTFQLSAVLTDQSTIFKTDALASEERDKRL